jgi:heme oxygenase
VDLLKLRSETEPHHRAVEDAVPLMHEGLDRAQYVQCLLQMYGIVAAWEERAVESAPESLKPTVLARQRRQSLQQDLEGFGVTDLPAARPALPAMNDLPSLLGAMYVMEGSTLGGQLIARHVERVLDLKEGHGSAFFRGYGDQTGSMWKGFCNLLSTEVPDEQGDAAIVAAKAMFVTYGKWMKEEPVSLVR